MTAIRFVKMSGAGNDFIVLDGADRGRLTPDLGSWVRRACRRGLSVGADGVVFVEASGPGRVRVSFHNPDGEPAFCGNASRCAARIAVLRDLCRSPLVLETAGFEVPAQVTDDRVRLSLPLPVDHGSRVVDIGQEPLAGQRIDAGAPHFVAFVEATESAPLETWGPRVRAHPVFRPGGTNVTVVARRGDGGLDVRTWERGVEGETLACGSGAVAAAWGAFRRGLGTAFRVIPRSGIALEVAFEGPSDRPLGAVLTGDARIVFEAELSPEGTSWAETREEPRAT